ncbi:MAG: DNA polymerase III subunit gamma/tau [Cyanothece sp. SIO1E1]|nr:DNA polymerase III subunit gamma/tau [Cyanothece sp. SIO1E1]
MTYEPLHHKYRPQYFAQLVGQGAIATTLSNALQQRRIAPAYLFSGPRGTGKTSSARILAKSLNCIQSQGPTDQPCGECQTCREITSGAALDVIEIDAASNTGVDNIRELIERAQFAPVQCRYKVYVIDECHMLSTAAFNALLKTLEEPPDRVVFVLATTDPQRVLPTIISRCQRFDFRRIPLEEMVTHLRQIADQEKINIADEAVRLVAQTAQGGLRDAESLLDQLSLLAGQITIERVWDLVGAVPERDLLALVQAIAQDEATAVLDCARHLMDRGREPLIVLQGLASFYRDLLIAKTARDRHDLVTITPPTWAELCDFAETVDLATILMGQQHLRTAEVQVKNTTQPRLWLEITLLGLLPSTIASQRSATHSQQPKVPGPKNSLQKTSLQKTSLQKNSPQTPDINRQQLTTQSPTQPQPQAKVEPAPVSPPPPAAPVESKSKPEPKSKPELTPPPIAEPTPPTAAKIDHGPTNTPPPEIPVTEETQAEATPIEEEEPAAEFDLAQVWQKVIDCLRPPGTQALLRQQARLTQFDGQKAQISISSQPLFKLAKNRLPNVEAAFEQVFQAKVTVTLEVAATPATETKSGTSTQNGSKSPPATNPKPAPQPKTAPTSPPQPPTLRANPQEHSPSVNAASSPIEPPPGSDVTEIPPAAEPWQGDDEVTRATKSLAQFFNGQIVDADASLTQDAGEQTSEPTESNLNQIDDEEAPF